MRPYYHDPDANLTIYHGDGRLILPQLERVDVVLTDPPYGKYLRYGDSSTDSEAAFHDHVTWLAGLGAPTAFTVPATRVYDLPRPQWLGVWHKPLTMGFFSTPFIPHWEAIAFYNMPAKGSRSDVWTVNPEKPKDHPAPKPIQLWLSLLLCMPPGVVVDPFMGSGTTLVAAKQLGRPAVGVELEEKFCEVAVRRLAQGVLPLAG